MTDQTGRFRDPQGRVSTLPALLGFTLAGLVTGLVALLAVDVIMVLIGRGELGGANGWLAVVLPTWLFILEEFRAWHGVPGRLLAAGVGLPVALALGLLAAEVAGELPPLASGAVGATVASFGYAIFWFHGVRWLARRDSAER